MRLTESPRVRRIATVMPVTTRYFLRPFACCIPEDSRGLLIMIVYRTGVLCSEQALNMLYHNGSDGVHHVFTSVGDDFKEFINLF